MKKLLLTFLSIGCLHICLAQSPQIKIQVDEGVNPWNHLEVNNGQETFQFAIVTDRTGGLRQGIFATAVPKLNLLQPEFVMSVGDLITGYTEDEAVIDREWDEFDGFIKDLEMPFFYVPGNHDYINDVMAKKWKERLGKDFYHFTYKDVLFLCLNTEELKRGAGKGYIDDPQYAYIEKTLKENADVKWTLVFMHQPLWDQKDHGRWGDVEQLLADRKHTVFAGHRHRFVKYNRNNSKYFILATTGGGSGLRGPNFGEFDHVVWITMTDDGPIMANLMLEGIWDENVNTEEYYSFSRPLMGKRAWDINPIFEKGDGYKGGELSIKLTNNSDVPMQAELSLQAHPNLWAQTGAMTMKLEPNTVESIQIPLTTKDDKSLKINSPLKIDFRTTYMPDGQPELVLEGTELVQPIGFRSIPQAKSAIKVDGNRDDWAVLRYKSSPNDFNETTPITHRGMEDCNFAFDLQYDEDFVYVLAEVKDDQIESKEGLAATELDALTLAFDARPSEKSIKGKGTGYFRDVFFYILSPGPDKTIAFWEDRYPENSQYVAKRIAGGYRVELGIPVPYLDQHYGDAWKDLRVNIIAHDSDYEGEHQSEIYWQPDWRSKKNVMGSGMFRKN